MASRSFSLVFCLVLLVALRLQEAAATRKVLGVGLKEKKLHEEAAGSGSASSSSIVEEKENLVGWELRRVPSGPDPLHHNGNSPKKPRTDP